MIYLYDMQNEFKTCTFSIDNFVLRFPKTSSFGLLPVLFLVHLKVPFMFIRVFVLCK